MLVSVRDFKRDREWSLFKECSAFRIEVSFNRGSAIFP